MDHDTYIGLISGTSMDAIDAVAVSFGERNVIILGQLAVPYTDDLSARIAAVSGAEQYSVDDLGALNVKIGDAFANAALAVMREAAIEPASVAAIGSHGQTVRHRPEVETPFSLQLGCGATIAVRTGIPTVCDFRSADVALGGQGAPLVPAFHGWIFSRPGTARCVVNIGGIGNITVVGESGVTAGYDTGPGNTLLDTWARINLGRPFDADGAWAASGAVDQSLLETMLADPYFSMQPPKSTGPETFSKSWLDRILESVQADLSPENVQSTLLQLTVSSISSCIADHDGVDAVAVCGGGASNGELMRRLAEALDPVPVSDTSNWGLHPDWVEACAFAWLARARLRGETGNVPLVTGASRGTVLGALYT